MEKEKKNLQVLLVKIGDKLGLLRNQVAVYETKIPTVAARIRQAQAHLKEKNIRDLFIDLSWITKTIFSKKALRQKFERQTLDLNILKQDLSRYLAAEPATSLAQAIQNCRKKILQAVSQVEQDFRIIETELGWLNWQIRKSHLNFMGLEKKMRDIILVPSPESEKNIVSLLWFMTQEVSLVNSILLSPGKIKPITEARVQELRRLLLQDWNTLLQRMAVLFTDAFKDIKPIKEIRIIVGRTGVPELSM